MKKIFAILSLTVALASCSNEIDSSVEMTSGEGAVRLGVAMQANTNLDDENVIIKIYKVEGEEQQLVRRYEKIGRAHV